MQSDKVKRGRKRKWDEAPSEKAGRPEALVIWLHGLGDTGEGWHTFKYDVKSDANGESIPENEEFFERVQWRFPTARISPVMANDGECMERPSFAPCCPVVILTLAS